MCEDGGMVGVQAKVRGATVISENIPFVDVLTQTLTSSRKKAQVNVSSRYIAPPHTSSVTVTASSCTAELSVHIVLYFHRTIPT